jgi:hypothetical protein
MIPPGTLINVEPFLLNQHLNGKFLLPTAPLALHSETNLVASQIDWMMW